MAVSGGPRGRSERTDGRETKARLVAAATQSLREVGFAGTSAREVARRAGTHQSQVFYYFGTVPDLLLAALDAVSERRLTAYDGLLAGAHSSADLIEAAGEIIASDLATGDVAILTELLSGSRSVPGMSEQVAARLRPWEEFAERAVRQAASAHPLGALAPTADLAHLVVATILGLELLASVDPDPQRLPDLLDRAAATAALLTALMPASARPDAVGALPYPVAAHPAYEVEGTS